MGGVARNHRVVSGDGQEVGQLLAGGELMEQFNCLREVAAVPARLSQLPAEGTAGVLIVMAMLPMLAGLIVRSNTTHLV